jgi:hypothetical protein
MLLEKLTQPEFSRDAAQELPWLKVDLLRGRQLLAVGIVFQLGDIVTGIGFRVSAYRIVIQHTEYFGHFSLPKKSNSGKNSRYGTG